MNALITTIIGALVLLILASLLLGIGWLLTGKSRIRRGTCGMVPQKKGEKENEEPCSICGATKICEREEDEK